MRHRAAIMSSPSLVVGARVRTGPGGAVVYRSRVRRTSYVLTPGMLGQVTQVNGNFRGFTTGHSRPPWCHLVIAGRPEACRASHIHSHLVHVRDLEEATP